MPQNLKHYQKVTLDGKEYIINFDFNAACELEEIFGKGIAAILNEEQVGFRLVRAFYYAGLKWKFPTVTLDQVGQIVGKELQNGQSDFQDLMKPVMEALTKSGLLGSKKKKGQESKTDAAPNPLLEGHEDEEPQEEANPLEGSNNPLEVVDNKENEDPNA